MSFSFDQPFVIVAGVLERDGKYLLIQENHTPDQGKWNFPGGKLDMEEDLTLAVVREVLEETGLQFTPTDLVGVQTVVRHDVPGRPDAQHTVRFLFAGTTTGEVTLGDGDGSEEVPEIAAYQWLTNSEIQALDNAVLRQAAIKAAVAEHAAGVRYPLTLLKHFTQG